MITPEARAVILSELERCRPFIEEALARQPIYVWSDVVEAVEEDRAQLWPGKRAAMVTTLEDYVRGDRVIQGWLAGGDGDEIIRDLIPQAEAQAVAWGCNYVLIDGGRRGWERRLGPSGYRATRVVLLKSLDRPATPAVYERAAA